MRAKDIDRGIAQSRFGEPFIVWTNVSGQRVRVKVDYGFTYSRSSYGRRVRRYSVTRIDNGKQLPKARTAASLHCTDGNWPSMMETQDRPAAAATFGVEATDGSGYARNGLVFATELEAKAYARDLFGRWLGCTDARSIEVTEKVNYRWTDGELIAL
jgi:hypothetical protein